MLARLSIIGANKIGVSPCDPRHFGYFAYKSNRSSATAHIDAMHQQVLAAGRSYASIDVVLAAETLVGAYWERGSAVSSRAWSHQRCLMWPQVTLDIVISHVTAV